MRQKLTKKMFNDKELYSIALAVQHRAKYLMNITDNNSAEGKILEELYNRIMDNITQHAETLG